MLRAQRAREFMACPGMGEKVPGMDVQPLLPLIQASIRAFRMGLGKIVSRDKVEAESGF